MVRKAKVRPVGRDHVNVHPGLLELRQARPLPVLRRFPNYLGEISYRYNHRTEDLRPAITRLLKRP